MTHLHMKIQVLQSIKEIPPDKDLKNKSKTNVVFCKTMEPSILNEELFHSHLCGLLRNTPSKGKKYIYVMHVYHCNAILTTKKKNRSNKKMIQGFKELTDDLKKVE